MTKTFFLGLGGQKCGSSWIQTYLAGQKGSDFGRLGEYQVWESDLGGVFARYRVPEPASIDKLRARAKRALKAPEPVPHLRWRLQSDREAYFDYFATLLARPGIQRSGDITPSYAALPAATLTRIADGMTQRGITTKALFAMRDPVARLLSHLRMDMDKGYVPQGDLAATLETFHTGPEATARARYDLTLEALDMAFAPQDRHVMLFEDLFTPTGIAALSAFADVPADPSAGAAQVNARGGGGSPIPDALTARIVRHYAPVYRAVLARFPQAETLWPSARFL